MEDSFSVRVKIETATQAVKKPIQRQTALCGLILCGTHSDTKIEIKIPERLTELVEHLFQAENISCSCTKNKISIRDFASSQLYVRYNELQEAIKNETLTVEEARRLLRGAFWSTGYCSDPNKNYRIEFLLPDENVAGIVSASLNVLSIKHIKTTRKNAICVYFKNGDDVSDFLSYIGSPSAMMEFENVRAGKDVNSMVTRAVNCDEGITKRQAEAAAARNEYIKKIMESGMVNKLAPELREAAKAQFENPGASIAELGAMMDPPIGKSGMKHRLAKIAEFAKSLE